ncbi:hypothetical protein [Stigmatella aurantiaca]|uniref:hypothetical protein n=1 Tax=Stigmatella aurantiaca TaxID=41 RepID=UPI0011603A9B|nr:hypothetical protein [Stigmatella aurantiaca]
MKQYILLAAFCFLYGLMGCGPAVDESSQQDSTSAGISQEAPPSNEVSAEDVETSAKRCIVSCSAVSVSTGAACAPVRGSARTKVFGGCKKACQWATEDAEGQAAQSGCRLTTCAEECH